MSSSHWPMLSFYAWITSTSQVTSASRTTCSMFCWKGSSRGRTRRRPHRQIPSDSVYANGRRTVGRVDQYFASKRRGGQGEPPRQFRGLPRVCGVLLKVPVSTTSRAYEGVTGDSVAQS